MNAGIIKASTIYLGANLYSRAIPFLLLPLLTFYLSSDDYGRLGLFQALISLTIPFVGLSLSTNITRNAHLIESDKFKHITSNLVRILTKTTVFTLIIAIAITTLLSLETVELPFNSKLIPLLPVISALSTLNLIFLAIFRNSNRAEDYAKSEIIRATLFGATTLFLLFHFSISWIAIIASQIISLALVCTNNIKRTSKFFLPITVYPNKNVRDEILKVSLPLVPHALATSSIIIIDRIVLGIYCGLNEIGVYFLAFQIGSITSILIDAVILAWSPWFYKKIKASENKPEIVKKTYAITLFFTAIAILIGFIFPFVINEFFPSSYSDSSKLVPYIALACLAHGLYKLAMPYLVYTKNTKALAKSTLIAACSNLVLNLAMIPELGPKGAAISTGISYAIAFLLVFKVATEITPMPWVAKSK